MSFFKVKVDCQAGHRGEQTPQRFTIWQRELAVTEVIDQWLAPDHRYFKVLAEDQSQYILRHEVGAEDWELTMYTRPPARGLMH